MSKRRVGDDDFEAHRGAIVELYIQENQPLSDVIKKMARQGFSKTYVHAWTLRISLRHLLTHSVNHSMSSPSRNGESRKISGKKSGDTLLLVFARERSKASVPS
jgi:hypothetical protein